MHWSPKPSSYIYTYLYQVYLTPVLRGWFITEVQCDNPGSPDNGYMQGTEPFKAGDVVQFNCNNEFMMEGQPIIACQDNGRWSGPLPKCKPTSKIAQHPLKCHLTFDIGVQACSYPGTTISGRMSLVKFYYKIGENITFTCDEAYSLKGAAMLKCLRNGKWSNAIPNCVADDAGLIGRWRKKRSHACPYNKKTSAHILHY